MKINEIFYSIQGESSYAGARTVFIRTTACHLRCNYCDTKYSYHQGVEKSVDTVIEEVDVFQAPYVCLTGGEPLLQKESFELMTKLCDRGYHVSLETSGAKSIRGVDPRVKIILDVKTPDSGAADSFVMENLQTCSSSTEFKFVICSEKDFEWSEKFCQQHDLFSKYLVLYSPAFESISTQWLAEKMLKSKSNARLHMQLHKYIWAPETRGV